MTKRIVCTVPNAEHKNKNGKYSTKRMFVDYICKAVEEVCNNELNNEDYITDIKFTVNIETASALNYNIKINRFVTEEVNKNDNIN